MNSIMPHGYSKAATRKRLIEEFTKARAQDLANANPPEQERIRKEIENEADRKLTEIYSKLAGHSPILWSH